MQNDCKKWMEKKGNKETLVEIYNFNYNLPLRFSRKSKPVEFYFDEDGIYRSRLITLSECMVTTVPNVRFRISHYNYDIDFGVSWDYLNGIRGSSFYRALCRLKTDESTFDDWMRLGVDIFFHSENYGSYKNHDEKKDYYTSWKQESRVNPIVRFVTLSREIQFSRMPENPNPNSFDYISVIAYISAVDDKLQFAREHHKEIFQLMLDKIESRKRFKKYGVPIGILKVGRCVLGRDGYLYVTFEIKDELRNLFETEIKEELA